MGINTHKTLSEASVNDSTELINSLREKASATNAVNRQLAIKIKKQCPINTG